nr:glutaredoxin (GRX) [Polytomella parva]|eukprot:CAMPEP_0175076134 /NCGR_PEP_ID=MMETSP0052_2-20121109/22517_1 /TAXON_ID=51329 ORGANISM="Polytomella parva, Strain SAG 63-3" /NCGR_SAMPLE_ID=MMETSP0052_2 /ASSEMBLY_ACC=CAM_ASM_000194 /LENGTH=106 /DNA_ID=CAMNT_0016345157 /DNA_START=71 /DNA_END=391 /DNA_ORIENTATION=+
MSSKADTIKSTVSSNKVVIYSKTFCPYCRKVKKLFNELKESPEVIELDKLDDGKDLQDTLKSITGKGTVPQVFVNGHFVGGCDDTYAAHQAGNLKPLLDGVSASKL